MHKHRCFSCGYVWEHSDQCTDFSREIWLLSHSCPSCGQSEVTEKYFGDIQARVREVCLPNGIKIMAAAA